MRQIKAIILILTLSSCINSNEQDNNPQSTTLDSLSHNQSDNEQSPDVTPTIFISDRYFKFIQYLDSLDIKNDTLRFTKVSKLYPNSNYKILLIDKYPIYKLDIHSTAPFENNERLIWTRGGDTISEFYNSHKIDTTEYNKVKNIWGYFLVSGANNKDDFGFIEEWEFPDNKTAKDLAEKLDYNMDFAYFKRGAYIFYIENYMYVFHSRYGIWPLRKLVKIFKEKYKAEVPPKTKEILENYP